MEFQFTTDGGGFGEVETFRLTEDCEDMVSRFLSNTSRALLLQVSEEIVLDTAYIGEVFGIGREETGRYYLLEKMRIAPAVPFTRRFPQLASLFRRISIKSLSAINRLSLKVINFSGLM